jgi:agmatine deiminase
MSSWRMPAEWEPHERTWMAFPPPNATFGDEGSATLETARSAWSEVANTIARYEPVTLIAGIGQGAVASARSGPAVSVIERPLDDAWARDIGPTFTLRGSQLGAIDWVFNGWGKQSWAAWDHDARLASDIGAQVGADVRHSRLTNEGGGFHVDGAGTVLLTDTVQLDPDRNPGWTRSQVEAEIHAQLGTHHAIWLPHGLSRDYGEFGTRGHVDIVATFVAPGLVAAHAQHDPAHPDYEVTKELVALLRASSDASGRSLEVVEIPAPTITVDDEGWNDYSYINHYVGNGFVVVGVFDDANDEVALDLLAQLYPGRRIEQVGGRAIFAFGGGVHCITQQQPRAA